MQKMFMIMVMVAFVADPMMGTAWAGTFTWDAGGVGAVIDGGGNWSTNNANWWNGAADVVWPNTTSDVAVIGNNNGAAGTVTVVGTLTLAGITFNPAGSDTYSVGSGTLTLAGPTITANTNAIISSVLAGTVGLTKAGAGTLTLSGANTYSGSTTITAGMLKLGGIGGITGSTLSVRGSGTFTIQDSATVAFTNAVLLGDTASGNVGNAVQNGGTFTFVGANGLFRVGHYPSETSTYTITGGVLSSSVSRISVGWDGSGVLNVAGGLVVVPQVVINDSATSNGGTTDTLNLTGGELRVGGSGITSVGGAATLNLGGGTLSSSATWSSSFAGILTGTGGSVTLAPVAGTAITLSGILSGVGGLAKVGVGTLTLSGANTYAGSTTANAGTLTLANTGNSGGTLRGGGMLTINSGATVFATGNDNSLGNTYPIIVNAGGLLLGDATHTDHCGTLTLAGGTVAANGAASGNGLTYGVFNYDYTVSTTGLGNTSTMTGGTAALTQTGGTVFNVGSNDTLYVSTVLAHITGVGDNGLNKSGAGTLTLAGVNTYTGATTVNGGKLVVDGSVAAGSAVTINSGGVLGGSGSVSGSVVVVSGGVIAPGDGLGTMTVGSLTLNSGSVNAFECDGSPTNDMITIANAGGLTNNGTAFLLYSNATTSTWVPTPGSSLTLIRYSGNISGSGSFGVANPVPGIGYLFSTNGASVTLTILGASAWTGGSASNSLWQTPENWGGIAPSNGAALVFDGNSRASNTNDFTTNSTFSIQFSGSAGSFSLAGNPFVLGGDVVSQSTNSQTLNLGMSLPVTRTFNTTNASMTVNGILSGSGGVIKAGSGTLTLNGNNTFTGTTVINGGALVMNCNGGSSYIYSGGGIFINNGSLLSIGWLGTGIGQYHFNGTTFTFDSGGGGTLFVANGVNFVDDSTLTFTTLGGAQNVISGTSSSVNLNTKTATFNVARGTDASDLTVAAPLWNGGSIIKTGAGVMTLTATNTYTGVTTISDGTLRVGAGGVVGVLPGNAVNNANLVFNRSDSVTYSGVVSGGGALIQAGPGTLTLSGANTFTGVTSISNGTVRVGNIAALQNSVLDYNNYGGVLSFGGLTNLTLGALQGTQDLSLINTGSVAVVLTVGNGNQSTVYSGVLSGGGSLVKAGSGMFTLAAASTYAGGTTVSAGTLKVNNADGSGTGSGVTTVAKGGALAGTGTVAVVTVSAGGLLAPGDLAVSGGIGSLIVSNLTLAAGATLNIQYSSNTSDRVVVTGTLTLPSAMTAQVFAVEGTGMPSNLVIASSSTPIMEPVGGFTNWVLVGGATSVAVQDGTNLVLTLGGAITYPSLYWDINGTADGAGGVSPGGLWDGVTTNWNTDSSGGAGGALVAATATNEDVIFAASTNATGSYTVDLAGGTRNAGALTVQEGTVTMQNGTVNAVGSVTVGAGASAVIAATVVGAQAGITLNGTALTLSSTTNRFTGPVVVQAGTLTFKTVTNVGAGASSLGAPVDATNGTIMIAGGATLAYAGTSSQSSDRPIALSGTSGSTYTLSQSGSGSVMEWAGSIGGATGSGSATLNIVGQNWVYLSGIISNVGAQVLSVQGNTDQASYRLSATNNTFTGNVTIGANRTLQVTKLANKGQPSSIGAGSGPIYFAYRPGYQNTSLEYIGTTDSSTDRGLNANSYYNGNAKYVVNNSPTDAALSFTDPNSFSWTVPYDSLNYLVLGGSSRGTNQFAMRIYDVSSTKTMQVQISGNGTWVFSNTNHTYTGGTVINGGKLMINGALTMPANTVWVNASGSLGGTGTVAGVVNVAANGMMTAGFGGVGTLNLFSNLVFNGASASTNRVRIAGSAPGQYGTIHVVGGSVTLNNATLAIDTTGASVPPGGTIWLIIKDSSGPVSGIFNGLPEGAIVRSGTMIRQITYQAGDGNDVALRPLPWTLIMVQ